MSIYRTIRPTLVFIDVMPNTLHDVEAVHGIC